MILYLDASALVKCYVSERGSDKVLQTLAEAQAVATSATSLAEVVAAFSKAARHGLLTPEEAESAHKRFRQEWPDFLRLPITAPLLERAADLAWSLGLRGYDSVQLAAAATWQEAMEGTVTFSTFDRHLWSAASEIGLTASPDDLPALLDSWRPSGNTLSGAPSNVRRPEPTCALVLRDPQSTADEFASALPRRQPVARRLRA